MVFSGHAHQLELLQKSGVSYVICGAFGGLPDPYGDSYLSGRADPYANGDYAFMDVTINGADANLIFRDSHGKVLNSYVITKH